jgi:hypothetical protein
MNKLLHLLFVASMCYTARAQTVTPTVISSNGGSHTSLSGTVEWTIGEPVSGTNQTSSNITTVGFHQPLIYVVTMISENKKNSEKVVVFPNPVKDELQLNFEGMKPGKYRINVTDAIGKLILFTDADISETTREVKLRMTGIAEGTYMLQVNNKEVNATVKLNKVN